MGNIFKTLTFQNVDLPPMGVDPDSIIVAGHSCGSMMANNMVIIESETFSGAALYNGAVFYGGDFDDSFVPDYASQT